MMDPEESARWSELLRSPAFSAQDDQEELYRAACIGAVTLLYESGSCSALADAVRHASAGESRVRALLALENLTRGSEPVRDPAVRFLHELAILDGNPEAGDFLRKSSLQDKDAGWNSARMLLFEQKNRLLKEDPGPAHLTEMFLDADDVLQLRLIELGQKVLPNWAVLMRFYRDPSAENRSVLLDCFKSFSPDERKLLRYSVGKDPVISSAAADVYLRYEDDYLRKLCVENRLAPSDPTQEALLCFLSGQWERYYALDSDYRRIRIAYEGKDPELQRRLIVASRDSGNSAWLRDIDGSSENMPHGGSLSDQHLLAASLIDQRQWHRLWELLPNLPLLCMGPVCEALKGAGFSPMRADEKEFFLDLQSKIYNCAGLSPAPVRERFSEGRGMAVGICGGGPFIAVLFADRTILVWDTRDPFAEPIRIGSNHLNFRRAVISHDGKYLCTDCGSSGITIFSLPGGQAVKTFTAGSSLIAGLFLQQDDRRLVILQQNGKGFVYSFPGITELHSFDLGQKDCIRASYDAGNNILCGITLSGDCAVYDLNGKRLLNAARFGKPVLAAAETFSRSRLPLVTDREKLSLVNLLSGKEIFEKNSGNAVTVRRLLPMAEGDLFVLGCLDGQIRIYDPTAENFPAVLSFGVKSAVTGLWYDEENAVLYGCNAIGTVRSWDLRLFRSMTRVLPLLQLPGLNRIDDYVKKYPEPGVKAAAAWLKTVVAWRRRFDIEIEF